MLKCRPIKPDERLLGVLFHDLDSLTDIILPTNRLIRAFIGSLGGPEEAVNILPISIFFDGFIRTDGSYHISDEDVEWFALKEALGVSSDAVMAISGTSTDEVLRDFSKFKEFSLGLLDFFKELCENMIDFKVLAEASAYSDYQTHVSSVSSVYETFLGILEKWGFVYRHENKRLFNVSLPRGRSFGVVVSGILTLYEKRVLIELSERNDVTVYFEDSVSGLCSYTRRAVPLGYISVYKCDGNTSMASWIVGIVRKELSYGTDPDKIGVVLPDETLSGLLRSIDKNLFNFTKGFPIKESMFFSFMSVISDCLKLGDNVIDLRDRCLKRLKAHPFWTYSDDKLGLGALVQLYRSPAVRIQDMAGVVLDLLKRLALRYEGSSENEDYYASKDVVFSTLEALSIMTDKYVRGTMDGASALDFILDKLGSSYYPDITESGVRVMGVLESRFLDFDVIVIPSLNEGVFPARSQKELFLNTAIRQKVGLPTKYDRERLQRSYVEGLIARSKRVYLGYIDTEDSPMSHVLREWRVKYNPKTFEWDGGSYLFDQPFVSGTLSTKRVADSVSKEGYGEYLRSMQYSASAFTTYKECGVKFYYKYVRGFSYEEDENKLPFEFGNVVHAAFERLYSENGGRPYRDENAIKSSFVRIFRDEVRRSSNSSPSLELRAEYFLERILDSGFFKDEVLLGPDKVITEWMVSKVINGITVVARIDRIDLYQDHVDVIDYKTGTVSGKINLFKPYHVQIPLYGLLVEKEFDKPIGFLGYYDFKGFLSGYDAPVRIRVNVDRAAFERDLNETICEILDAGQDFVRNTKACRTCEFKRLCHVM